MIDAITIRVSKKLKDKIQELNPDYAEEVRAYLEKRVKMKKAKQVMREIDKVRNELSKKLE